MFPSRAPSRSPGHVPLPPSRSGLGTSPSPVLPVQGWDWGKKPAGLFSPELIKPKVCLARCPASDNSPQLMPGEMQGRTNKQCVPRVLSLLPTICAQGPLEPEVLPLCYGRGWIFPLQMCPLSMQSFNILQQGVPWLHPALRENI